MIRRSLLLGLIAAAFAAQGALAESAPSFAPSPVPKPPIPVLDGAALVANSDVSGAIAFLVVDLKTGLPLEGSNADLPLPPASVAKVPTALYALDALGPDHRFETRLVALGPRVDGVLKGDLVLQGGGDPETDTSDLDLLAFRAAEAGLTRVQGGFLVDDALLPRIDRIDQTQPEVASYNPSIGALNLNFNRVFTEWRRKSGGYDVKVQARAAGLSPPTDFARVEVVERTFAPSFDFVPNAEVETWRVARGALGKNGSRWLPVRKPALYAGGTFRTLAEKAGVVLPAPQRGSAPLVADVIARVQSRPLADILRDMLRYSTNLTAEATGLAATSALSGGAESLETSGKAMTAWAARFTGAQTGEAGFDFMNHSGLSGDSRATAQRLVDLLLAADKRGFPALNGGRGAALRGLLPTKPYLDDGARPTLVNASLRAKTGTLDFVSALAGYIDVETGDRFAFAILTADMLRREGRGVAVESPVGGKGWAARSRRLQRALVRSWIDRFAGGARSAPSVSPAALEIGESAEAPLAPGAVSASAATEAAPIVSPQD